MFASTACAIHCAVCAIAPGALAVLGLGALLGHEAEWGFSLVAICFAAVALVLGWRRHHSAKIAVMFGIGIAGLLIARLLEEAGVHELGTAIGIASGMGLVFSHVLNLRTARPTEPLSA